MNPWWGKGLLLAGLAASIGIRWPHDARKGTVRVLESRRGPLELLLLFLMGLGTMALPVLAVATPTLAFADYPLRPWAFGSGTVFLALALWLFHRSHADLGTNWSPTLEIREGHRLIDTGIYGKLRHPMYSSIYLLAAAQALLLPNWIAGPSMLAAFTCMFFVRLRTEERMMLERFGREYEDYRKRTARLIPGVW